VGEGDSNPDYDRLAGGRVSSPVGCPDFKPGEVCKTGLMGSTPASSAIYQTIIGLAH